MTPPKNPGRQLGVTFGFNAPNGYFGSAAARTEVDRMAGLGVRWVCVVPTVYQDKVGDTRQYRDFALTPDDAELRRIIEHIHGRGMKVKLRPMLEMHDSNDRLSVWFPPDRERIPGRFSRHWAEWFASMRARSVHYARIAQQTGCELYGLDSELDRTIAEHTDAHWRNVLHAVREVYAGPVDSCHTMVLDFVKELSRKDHWWYELDTLSCSAYFRAYESPADNSVEAMVAYLTKTRLEWGREVARLFGKPFFFGELGCSSTAGAALSPGGWPDGGYSGEEQANYLEASCRVFWPEAWWQGFYWWKWEEQTPRPHHLNDPRGNKGFTLWGKPAAEVLQRWCARA